MQQDAIRKARDRLLSAKSHLMDLEKSRDYGSARRHWYGFLMPSNAVFSVLEQGAKGFGKSVPWFGERRHQRKKDPLLRYLHHARNAEEHGVPSVTELDRQKIVLVEDGKPTAAVEEIVGNTGRFRTLSDQPPNFEKVNEMRVYPDRARLIRVKDNNEWYDPPTEHLGLPLDDVGPIAVARLMVQYIEKMIDEAEAFVPDVMI